MEEDNAFQTTDTTGQEKKNSEPQEDWKDYAYGGKSLLDDSSVAQESADIRPESSKPTDLEQKRNLVIEYIPLVENTEMEQRPESQDSEQK